MCEKIEILVQMQPNMQSLFLKRVFPPDSILLVVISSRK